MINLKAELIMIGNELLLGETVDTNAAFIAQELAKIGIKVNQKTTIADDLTEITEILSIALKRSQIIITSGGLGPTIDDLTRHAVAAASKQELEFREDALAVIKSYFCQRSRKMSDNNRQQAYLPKDAQFIENLWGTAPGILLELPENRTVISLPGVPRELKGMLLRTVVPHLKTKSSTKSANGCIVSKTLKFVGIGESDLAEAVDEVLKKQSNPVVAPYASLGEVKLRITAKASNNSEAQQLIKPLENRLKLLLKNYYYGTDNDTLESVLGARLSERNETLASAESCTGGLIAHRVTNVPGSSFYFKCGFITYSNKAKIQLLHVDPDLLQTYGAVSNKVAIAMAKGAKCITKADWSIAVTGIAGPGGATKNKPVGLVYIAVAGKGYTKSEVHQFSGNREEIKYRTSQAALNLLRLTVG